jgi:hypothetical protein
MPWLKRLEAPPKSNGHVVVSPFVKPDKQALTLPRTPVGIWGTSHDGKRQQRALLASAVNISNGGTVNRVEATRLSKLKQLWQEDAWAYRDSIGELRYATTYIGNAARKIRLYPAAYIPGNLEPQPLSAIDDCPPEVVAAADDALARLGANPLAMAGMLRDIAENFEVAGECFLLGWPVGTKDDNEEEIWEIRSSSEIKADNGGVLTIFEPGGNANETIPDEVFCSRLWFPHPKRKLLADSPFAAILDICEELLILSRDIRASGRSRLANNGLLLLPDTLTVVKANVAEDANDDEQDPFMQELIGAAMAAIQDEGSASAIVPIIVRGPRDDLAAARQLTISRPDSVNAQKRVELLERMATSLDLPAEVLTGKADLNHWTAWSVSDDTFSDHIEPLIMVIDDALTAGYLKMAMKAANVDPVWASRVLIWHDATMLVRHPDRSQDAISAYDRFAVSQKALRTTMGFSDSDAPSETETLQRVVLKQSRLDPAIVNQIIKRMDETLTLPPDPNAAGATPTPAESGGPPGAPPSLPVTPGGPPQNGQPKQESPDNPPNNPPPITGGGSGPKESVATSVPAHIKTGSKRLARIDAELVSKLLVATNAAMSRALERAGARIRTTVGRTASGRAWCATHSNLELPFLISRGMIAAAGLDESEILRDSWKTLAAEWDSYMESADMQALQTVAKMINVDPDQLASMAETLGDYADNAWTWLENKLQIAAHGYLTNPANIVEDLHAEITTTELVDYATVREAVSRAGGQPDSTSAGVRIGSDPTTLDEPLTGLGTGPIVSDVLTSNGLTIATYTWIHGTTPVPFPEHEALDGVEFSNWTDDVLANNGDWPDRDYFMPGDHDGCTCDFDIVWGPSSDSESGEQADDAAAADVGETASGVVTFGGPGSGPQGGRHPKEKSQTPRARRSRLESTDDMTPKAARKYAMQTAGIANSTAVKFQQQGEGTLDQAISLAQGQQPEAQTEDARQIATSKETSYAPTISDEDRQKAIERHERIMKYGSGRAGGDDRPPGPVRERLKQQLVTEYGDGKTCPCVYCGRTLVPDTISLERIVPGDVGGKYIMANLAPADYGCNLQRSTTDFQTALASARAGGYNSRTAAGDVPPGEDPSPATDSETPIIPLGTMVTGKCVGYSVDDIVYDTDPPAHIPLQYVTGKLDGYYVHAFGYYKYIVAGYDVEPESLVVLTDSQIAAETPDDTEDENAVTAGGPGSGPQGGRHPKEKSGKSSRAKGVDVHGVAGKDYFYAKADKLFAQKPAGNDQYDSKYFKSSVANSIAADPRMQAYSPEEIFSAGPPSNTSLISYLDASQSGNFISVDYDGKLVQVDADNNILDESNNWDQEHGDPVDPNSPEGQQMARAAACSDLVQQWAASSNDTNPTSIAMQDAAVKEFGIKDSVPWPTDAKTQDAVDRRMSTSGQVYQDFLRSQYDSTQAQFKADGVKSLDLYRGMTTPIDQMPVENNDYDHVEISSRPLSSWSVNSDTATTFAGAAGNGSLLSAQIPAENILSTPFTGNGCLDEGEMVVIGHGGQIAAVGVNPGQNYENSYEDEWDYEPGALPDVDTNLSTAAVALEILGRESFGGPGSGPQGGRHPKEKSEKSSGVKGVDANGVASKDYYDAKSGRVNPANAQAIHNEMLSRVASDPRMQAHSPDEIFSATNSQWGDKQSAIWEKAQASGRNVDLTKDGILKFAKAGSGADPNSPEGEQIARQAGVNGLVGHWAATSNGDATALAMQNAAEDTFGIKGATTWDNPKSADDLAKADELGSKYGTVYSDVLNAQYDATQEQFKADGVKSMDLYRGVETKYNSIVGPGDDPSSMEIASRPMSSWSVNPAVATGFANTNGGTIIQASVPVENIFSTPMTGSGTLTESEVIVLGHGGQMGSLTAGRVR